MIPEMRTVYLRVYRRVETPPSPTPSTHGQLVYGQLFPPHWTQTPRTARPHRRPLAAMARDRREPRSRSTQSVRLSGPRSRWRSISRAPSIEATFRLVHRHHGSDCVDASLGSDWSVSDAIKIRNYYDSGCADVGVLVIGRLSFVLKLAGNHGNGCAFCTLLENHKEKQMRPIVFTSFMVFYVI